MENATKTVGIMETGKEPGESVSREDGTQKNVYGQASLKVVCVHPECFVPNDKTKCVKIYLCSENVSAPVMRRRKRMIVDRHSKASPIPLSEKRWGSKDIFR